MKNLHLILNLIQVTWTLAINPSSLEHNCKQQKVNYLWIQFIFSCKSHSTIANVCPSVHLSVWGQNPSTAWNHHLSSFILHHSSFFTIFHHSLSSFIILHHPSAFLIHPSFISRLLSFSACLTRSNRQRIGRSIIICFLSYGFKRKADLFNSKIDNWLKQHLKVLICNYIE